MGRAWQTKQKREKRNVILERKCLSKCKSHSFGDQVKFWGEERKSIALKVEKKSKLVLDGGQATRTPTSK